MHDSNEEHNHEWGDVEKENLNNRTKSTDKKEPQLELSTKTTPSYITN